MAAPVVPQLPETREAERTLRSRLNDLLRARLMRCCVPPGLRLRLGQDFFAFPKGNEVGAISHLIDSPLPLPTSLLQTGASLLLAPMANTRSDRLSGCPRRLTRSVARSLIQHRGWPPCLATFCRRAQVEMVAASLTGPWRILAVHLEVGTADRSGVSAGCLLSSALGACSVGCAPCQKQVQDLARRKTGNHSHIDRMPQAGRCSRLAGLMVL